MICAENLDAAAGALGDQVVSDKAEWVVRWSARYDQTISFYRDIIGLPCWKPSTTATVWTARSLGCPAVPFT